MIEHGGDGAGVTEQGGDQAEEPEPYCARCYETLGPEEERVEEDGELWHPACRECDTCAGMEDVLVERAQEFKANGWDPDEDGDCYRYGMTEQCDDCGRWFDFGAADAAYEETPGPEAPTGSQADEVRRLAGDLDLDPGIVEVFRRRPMH